MNKSKEEIQKICSRFEFIENIDSNDIELKNVINNRNNFKPFEKPDAIYISEGNDIINIYGIEHFQISLYKNIRKKGDISKIALGSQGNRKMLKEDKTYDYQPSVCNLIDSLKRNLETHSKSFEEYKNHTTKEYNCNYEKYKLIIFIEDSSDPGYIVKDKTSELICPLKIRQFVDQLLKYKDWIWAVIYTTGIDETKTITGYTLGELEKRYDDLIDIKSCRPFETERVVFVSKNDDGNDSNEITINLNDHIF